MADKLKNATIATATATATDCGTTQTAVSPYEVEEIILLTQYLGSI